MNRKTIEKNRKYNIEQIKEHSTKGETIEVKRILTRIIDTRGYDSNQATELGNIALEYACIANKYNIIKSLLDQPINYSNNVLQVACIAGKYRILKMLLKDTKRRFDPSANHNYPIILACRYGHTRIVELLLTDPRVDPTDRRNQALKNAITYGHKPIVRILMEDPRLEETDPADFLLGMSSSSTGSMEASSLILSSTNVSQ